MPRNLTPEEQYALQASVDRDREGRPPLAPDGRVRLLAILGDRAAARVRTERQDQGPSPDPALTRDQGPSAPGRPAGRRTRREPPPPPGAVVQGWRDARG